MHFASLFDFLEKFFGVLDDTQFLLCRRGPGGWR